MDLACFLAENIVGDNDDDYDNDNDNDDGYDDDDDDELTWLGMQQ